MTYPVWPDTLPAAPLLDGMRETWPDTTLRTQMDQGPAKTRARHSAGVRKLEAGYHLSHTQLNTLEAFYLDTLAGGAVRFVYPHPRTGAMVVCRFTKPPEYIPLNGSVFRAAVSLEVLP